MAKPRVTATDRLANVIDVVGLGRRTGLLSAEREFGTMLEEAEIYFVSGNPIYATLGPLRGHAALDALAQWSVCRFCFDPQAPQPIPNVSGVLPAVDPSSPSGFSYAYAPASSNAANGPNGPASNAYYGSSSGFGSSGGGAGNRSYSGPSGPVSRTSWNSPPAGYPSGSLGGSKPSTPSGNSAGNLGANAGGAPGGDAGGSNSRWAASGIFGGTPGNSMSRPGWSGNTTTPRAGSNPAMAGAPNQSGQADVQRRPRRAPDVRDLINVVTTYNLSRAHRTILLLADGEHSILDLARLSGKPVDEVLALLGELEGRGLIYYYQ